MTEKSFKQLYSQSENRNNITREPIENGLEPNEQTFNRMFSFLRLSDTLVYTKKKYGGKAGSKLIIGENEKTVEIQRRNGVKIALEPDGSNSAVIVGPYVIQPDETDFKTLEIKVDGRYRIAQKEQVALTTTTTKVWSYIGWTTTDDEGNATDEVPIAVFDWEGKVDKTFTSSSVNDGGVGASTHSHTVRVQLNLGEMIQRMTGFGFNERDLKKGDILKFYCVDQDGNDLELEPYSNYRSVEYIDLPLSK